MKKKHRATGLLQAALLLLSGLSGFAVSGGLQTRIDGGHVNVFKSTCSFSDYLMGRGVSPDDRLPCQSSLAGY